LNNRAAPSLMPPTVARMMLSTTTSAPSASGSCDVANQASSRARVR
jgi:hypothetical protein